MGTQLRKDDKKSDRLAMNIKDNAPDRDVAEALLESGPLASGAMPAVNAATEEGSKAVLEALHGEVQKTKVRKIKEKDGEETEKMEPKQPWESGSKQHVSMQHTMALNVM